MEEVVALDKEGTARLWGKIQKYVDEKIEENKQPPGSAIKFRDITVVTDQYGQANIRNYSHGLLISANSNSYQFSVLPYSNDTMRVFNTTGNNPVVAKNTEVPMRIIYTEDYTQEREMKTGIVAKIKSLFGR